MNWKNNGEDIWVETKRGKETGYTITKIPPYSIGEFTQNDTKYKMNSRNKYLGSTPTLREAKQKIRNLR